MRTGDDDALRGLELEGKALTTAWPATAAILWTRRPRKRSKHVCRPPPRSAQIASVVNVEATSYDVLIDRTDVGAGWATEDRTACETATPQIERISIPLHELSAMPKASQRLLDDSAFDIEGWLAARIADKFARAEARPSFRVMASTSQRAF